MLKREDGAVMMIFVILLPVLISIIALVIDLQREQLSVRQIQNVADAMALAAVNQYDSSLAGWQRAKRAGTLVFRNNRIYGDSGPVPDEFALNSPNGVIDTTPGETGNYSSTQGVWENILVTVERGVYWESNDLNAEDKFEFISLEGSSLHATQNVPVRYGAPVHMFANAVRVRVELNGLWTSFARIFGVNTFNEFSRESIAVADSDIEECVLPVGVPLCSLALNTDPQTTDIFQTNQSNDVRARQICERELVATEANYTTPERYEGIVRSNTYPRPPYYYPGNIDAIGDELNPDHPIYRDTNKAWNQRPFLNYKGLPHSAVIGLPGKPGDSSHSASALEIGSTFSSLARRSGGCIKVKRGAKFKPLDQLTGLAGRFFDDPLVESRLAELINDQQAQDNFAFQEIFGNPNNPASFPLKPNFPFQRTLRQSFPEEENWGAQRITPYRELLLRPQAPQVPEDMPLLYSMDPNTWTNPMCHSAEITAADDPQNARVQEVRLMVIAPRDGEDYCDYDALFSGSQQRSRLPTSDTEPRVVGFVKAYFYDLNIMKLLPTPRYLHGAREIVDRNPSGAIKDYPSCMIGADGQCNSPGPYKTCSHVPGLNPLICNDPCSAIDTSGKDAQGVFQDLPFNYESCWPEYPAPYYTTIEHQNGTPALPNIPTNFEWHRDCLFHPLINLPSDKIDSLMQGKFPIPISPAGSEPDPLDQPFHFQRVNGVSRPYINPIWAFNSFVAEFPFFNDPQSFSTDPTYYQKALNLAAGIQGLDLNQAPAAIINQLSSARGSWFINPEYYTEDNEICAQDTFINDQIWALLGESPTTNSWALREDLCNTHWRSTSPPFSKFWWADYIGNKTQNRLSTAYNQMVMSQPDTACLPRKKPSCFPADSIECWTAPLPHRSQYGCGGLRMRLSCEPDQVLFSAKSDFERRPGLAQ